MTTWETIVSGPIINQSNDKQAYINLYFWFFSFLEEFERGEILSAHTTYYFFALVEGFLMSFHNNAFNLPAT